MTRMSSHHAIEARHRGRAFASLNVKSRTETFMIGSFGPLLGLRGEPELRLPSDGDHGFCKRRHAPDTQEAHVHWLLSVTFNGYPFFLRRSNLAGLPIMIASGSTSFMTTHRA